ncbi:MAG: hypothetical protein IJ677_05510 [Alphaproteobacteria bacterium]|nr:hypothetical protein [Alphaproteobacteria bacterium]
MNDLRKELERQFKEHGLMDDHAVNEVSDSFPETVSQSASSAPQVEETTVVQALLAPESYQEKFASDFKNLPQEWQVFLIEHENKNNEKYQQAVNGLQDYRLLEAQYENNRLRLQEQGIKKIQDWLSGLIWIDSEMARRPEQTLSAIAKVYGVKLEDDKHKRENVSDEMITRLNHLEQNFHEITSYLNGLQSQKMFDSLQMFGRQTDRDGNLLHPYFDAVQNQALELLLSGAARSPEEAYENALWLNPQVRSELIEQQISSRAAEAQKAHKAAFSPKGKSEAPEKPLTLREELEKNMAAFLD